MADILSFPSLPLILHGRPRPFFDTTIQNGRSGMEARIGRRAAGYRFPLDITLRAWLGEDATFFNFFSAVGGRRDSFLYTYTDPVTSVATTYRVRFDSDSLEDFNYEQGCYVGSIDLVTVAF